VGVPDSSLHGANLIQAKLNGVDFSGANLSGAGFVMADLAGAKLSGADLSKAILGKAILLFAELSEANLSGADLTEANFIGANLSGANLSGADLTMANLTMANLSGADLSGADLSGANLTRAVLVDTDLRGAKLRDCRIFGISAWDIKTDENTDQVNLLINKEQDLIMTVDNLKIAQFIYLLLHNEEIRNAIDTITSKVVLILGRFTPERKALLDSLREALRQRNYLPVMFDFDKPATRGYTETITTLARMARFIIADLTDATEVRVELAKIVPDLPSVPVQPLILASQIEYVTFVDIRRYPWVLEPFRYQDSAHAVASLREMLTPAEARLMELKE
jgi:uncharacterized protein YjbI with pentapeptide repeats